MKTYIIFFVLLVVLVPGTIYSAIISGKIQSSLNNEILMGHIRIMDLVDSMSTNLIEVKKDGSFEIQVNKIGFYECRVSAVNYSPLTFLIYIQNNQQIINMSIKLKPINVLSSDLYILGNFNNYQFDFKYPMDKLNDSLYRSNINYAGDTLIYQIYFYDKNNGYSRSFNGNNNQNFFKIDKGGDYYSVLIDTNKIKNVVYYLYKYSNEDTSAVINFTNDKENAEFYTLQETLKEDDDFFHNLSNSFRGVNPVKRKTKLSLGELKGILQSNITKLKAIYDTTKNLSIKKYVAVNVTNYLALAYLFDKIQVLGIKLYPIDIDNNFIKQTLALVPIENPLREYLEWDIGFIFTTCLMANNNDDEKRNTYFIQYINSSLNTGKKIEELKSAIYYYKLERYNEELYRYYSCLLVSNFPNDPLSISLTTEMNSELHIGKEIPTFEVRQLFDSTNTYSHKDLLGKYTIIDFWSTSCGPCIQEIPNLIRAKEAYKDLNILSISFDEEKSKVVKFLSQKYNMPWMQAIEENSFNSNIAKKYGVYAIPKLILVDPYLKVVAMESELRGDKLFKTLDKIFNK
jgi:thiol-disulfide isomerase/thioredoxin